MIDMGWMTSGWFWWALALALLAAEALAPGIFLLWLGFAAAGTAVLRLLVPGLAPELQWMLFSALSIVSVAIAWRLKKTRPLAVTDQPLLNRRAEQLVGRVLVLDQAIVDGRGRIKVGDAFWTATGPDLAAGSRVKVVAVRDLTLDVVEAGQA